MRTSLFSQSVASLSLEDAIRVTAEIGYDAIELACFPPHFDLSLARRCPGEIADRVKDIGLKVSALSLINNLTDRGCLAEQIESAVAFIRLGPLFETTTIKLTPGAPGSADATAAHWRCLEEGVNALIQEARYAGVRLAFETHMRQVTDTLAGSLRLLEMTPPDLVGLTVDFSNLSFAGEDMSSTIPLLAGRIYHSHVKNGYMDNEGGWHFLSLDTGLTDYSQVLPMLRAAGYDGYLSVECLGEAARTDPAGTAARDFAILRGFLNELDRKRTKE